MESTWAIKKSISAIIDSKQTTGLFKALNPIMHSVPKWSDTLLKVFQQIIPDF